MRAFETDGKISVCLVAGTLVVLLGINASEDAKDSLLGFTIEAKNGTRFQYGLDCSTSPYRLLR